MVFVYLMTFCDITVSFYLALLFNFNTLESSLILGISSHSIEINGNIGVIYINNKMYLLPFVIIITRITGIFIFSSFYFNILCKKDNVYFLLLLFKLTMIKVIIESF